MGGSKVASKYLIINPLVTLRILAHAIYRDFFSVVKNENLDFFLFLLQNIDCGYSLEPPHRGGSNEYPQSMFCGYSLEPPHRGGSNEYPQSMFWSKNKKNRLTPVYPTIAI